MLAILLATVVQYDFTDRPVPESIARECATEVGIPYASNSFSDTEWREFKRCILYRTNR